MSGERVRASALFGAAALRIVDAGDPSSARYAEAAIKAGHLAAWMASVARTGAPPPSPGPEPTTEPFPGQVWARRPGLTDQYPTPSAAGLLVQVGRVASLCGNDVAALRAARRAVKAASDAGGRVMASLLEGERAKAASLLGQFPEAVDAAIRAFRAAAVARDGRNANPMTDPTDREDVWRRTPVAEKERTERLLFFA